MGRRKRDDPVGDALRQLRGCADELYSAALAPFPDLDAKQANAKWYEKIRRAYGAMLDVVTGFCDPLNVTWPVMIGMVPAHVLEPHGDDTGRGLQQWEGYRRREDADLNETIMVLTLNMQTFARHAAFRAVLWLTETADRMESAAAPSGVYRARGDSVELVVTLAGITRRRKVSGAPGALLRDLLGTGKASAKADDRLYLGRAVPELHDAITAAPKKRTRYGSRNPVYEMEAFIRGRFRLVKQLPGAN